LVVVVQGEGPGCRDRQVLVVAVGSAVVQVQPAGPGRAARRVHHARRVGRNPQSGQALCRFTSQSLRRMPAPSIFFSVAGVQLCTYAFVCDILVRFV